MPICPHASEGAFCPKSLSYIKNSDLFFVIAILGKRFEKASVRAPMENLSIEQIGNPHEVNRLCRIAQYRDFLFDKSRRGNKAGSRVRG
jgi:hypothetical protein